MSKPGTPLGQVGLLDSHHLQIMAALSVTTVEDLDGLLHAAIDNPMLLASLMEGTDLTRLANDLVQAAGHPVRAVELDQQLLAEGYGLGAFPPEAQRVDGVAPLLDHPVELHRAAVALGFEAQALAQNCLGPVRDQGTRGTCVAHAITALREYLYCRASKQHVDLSEQFAYWDCKRTDGFAARSGTWLRVASYLLVRDGICTEQDWSYVPSPIPGNEGQGPAPLNALVQAKPFAIPRAIALPPSSVSALQAAIKSDFPVAVSIPVFNSWFRNPQVRLDGNITMPLPNEVPVGGHAVLTVGFAVDQDYAGGGYFIIRNSWGTRWASQNSFAPGYGTLPFNYVANYTWEAYSADNQ